MVAYSQNEPGIPGDHFDVHVTHESKRRGLPDIMEHLSAPNAAILSVWLGLANTVTAVLAADFPDTGRQWVDFLASRSTTVIECSALMWLVVGALAILMWRSRAISRMEQECQRTDEVLRRADRYNEMVHRVSALLAMKGQTTATSEPI